MTNWIIAIGTWIGLVALAAIIFHIKGIHKNANKKLAIVNWISVLLGATIGVGFFLHISN